MFVPPIASDLRPLKTIVLEEAAYHVGDTFTPNEGKRWRLQRFEIYNENGPLGLYPWVALIDEAGVIRSRVNTIYIIETEYVPPDILPDDEAPPPSH